MLPIVLDPGKVKIGLIGEGARTLGRLRMLADHGCAPHAVFAPDPVGELAREAGPALAQRWPTRADFADLHVAFAGDLPAHQAETFAALAETTKTLFNAEDATPFCAFHMPATVRRGGLLLTVSTDGAAPALARRLAAHLGNEFGPDWAGHVRALGEARAAWRAEGLDGAQISLKTEAMVAEKGWLS